MSAHDAINVVLPNCREHLTAEDVAFIGSVLCERDHEMEFLTDLLTDEQARNVILDNEKLLKAIQDRPDCLTISCYLYFYLVVRDGFKRCGLDDRELADYVAEILAEYTRAARVTHPLPDGELRTQYIVDMLTALRSRNGQERFKIRAHIGNFSLFMAGLYPGRIEYRQEHQGAPGLDYYEQIGSSSFDIASHLHLAEELELSGVLEKLAELFHRIRLALNDAKERLLFIRPPDSHLILLPALH